MARACFAPVDSLFEKDEPLQRKSGIGDINSLSSPKLLTPGAAAASPGTVSGGQNLGEEFTLTNSDTA